MAKPFESRKRSKPDNIMKKKKIKQQKSGLKMKELAEATGLAKSTLLYYVSLGLIPEPVKTSPNMAYYNPISVDRVKFIQDMKACYRLSLGEIRKLMEKWGDETSNSIYVEPIDLVFGSSQHETLLTRKAFLEATGLTSTQFEQLLKAGLLIPLKKDHFDRRDVIMGSALALGLSWGYRIEHLVFYVKAGELIADGELTLRKLLVRNLPTSDDVTMVLEMIKSARVCRAYVAERIFQCRLAEMEDK